MRRGVRFQQQALVRAVQPLKKVNVRLSKAQDSYAYFSGTASTIARQIAFAGIGVVWIFNISSTHATIAIPQQLKFVLLLLVVCLALDLLQYVIASVTWSVFARVLERRYPHRSTNDPEMDASPYLNWPALVCFWAKLAMLVFAYIYLAVFIASRLQVQTAV